MANKPRHFLTPRERSKVCDIIRFCGGTVTLAEIGRAADRGNPDLDSPAWQDICFSFLSTVCSLLRDRLFVRLCDEGRCTFPQIIELCDIYLQRYASHYFQFKFIDSEAGWRDLTELTPDYREVLAKLKTKFDGIRQWEWGDEPKHWRMQIQYESHYQVEKLIQTVVKCGSCQFFSPLTDVCLVPRRKKIETPSDAAKEPDFEENLLPKKYYSRGCSMFTAAAYDPDTDYLLSPNTLTGRIFDRLEELFLKRWTDALRVPSKAGKYLRQYRIVRSDEFVQAYWGMRLQMAGKLKVSMKTYDRDLVETKEEIKRLLKTDPVLTYLFDMLEAAN